MAQLYPIPHQQSIDPLEPLQINLDCDQIIAKVNARRIKLLNELREKREISRAQDIQYEDMIFQLTTTKSNVESGLTENPLKKIQVEIVAKMENELENLKLTSQKKILEYSMDSHFVEQALEELGEIREILVSENVDYKSKVHPVLSVSEKGNKMEQLNFPFGVKVDGETGNIYVADEWNHCVKVFTHSGNILFKFGDSDGEGKLVHPRCLLLTGNRILITHNHNIFVFRKNGEFESKIGKHGKGELEFEFPYGLACDESNRDTYICDSNNNRIQIISKEFTFKSQFGTDELKYPRDVRLSKEQIFILDKSNPCIHLYDYNHTRQRSVISRGEGMHLVNACCFHIDNSDNLLFSDAGSDSILIFNPQFNLIHKLNTSPYPRGLVVDNQRRVIVVYQSNKDCLQIF